MPGKFGVLNPFQKWEKGDPLGDPTVSIVLNEYGRSKEGIVSISGTLAADSEIDYAIDELQKNLEAIRKEAKQVLKVQRAKIRASFDENV